MTARPTSFPEWASDPIAGDITEPSDGRKASGWILDGGTPEKPPYPEFNWFMNLVYQWTLCMNASQPAGNISAFGGSLVPAGWLVCDGSEVSKTVYADLFAVIGSTWNSCKNPLDGSNYTPPTDDKFRLPDLRGSFIRGVGTFGDSRNVSLSGFQDDATAAAGLTMTAGSTTVAGSAASAGAHSHSLNIVSNVHTHSHAIGGGTASHTHTHTISATSDAYSHSHGYTAATDSGFSVNRRVTASSGYDVYSGSAGAHSHTLSGGTASNAHTHTTITSSINPHTHTHAIASGSVGTLGTHTHTVTGAMNSHTHIMTGDNETRPLNIGVKFIIKY